MALDGLRVAIEFRDDRWYVSGVRTVLERHNAALCLADRESRLVTPTWRTADWGYIRFHAGRGSPPGAYGETSLRARAQMLASLFGADADVFAYFNNDGHGCALRDASALRREVDRAGLRIAK